MSGRPLVVIAGWLGCQPRFLNRYSQLYQRLGFDVLPVIAPPVAVVAATFQIHPFQVPDEWPLGNRHREASSESMQSLAWEVLRQIEQKRTHSVIFHVFSNAGCFLWEHVRRILDDRSQFEEPTRQTLEELFGSQIQGVVFDSCPAWFGHDFSVLKHALEHCTMEEKEKVKERFGPSIFDAEEAQHFIRMRQRRNQEFFRFLLDDDMRIPQLYMYSTDDKLSDHTKIEALVQTRRNKMQEHSQIVQQRWDKSTHCAHVLHHPTEYCDAIQSFTTRMFGKQRSKL